MSGKENDWVVVGSTEQSLADLDVRLAVFMELNKRTTEVVRCSVQIVRCREAVRVSEYTYSQIVAVCGYSTQSEEALAIGRAFRNHMDLLKNAYCELEIAVSARDEYMKEHGLGRSYRHVPFKQSANRR